MNGPRTSASSFLAPERLFCLLVFALALFQFAENTADPDLWGHIVFGQRLLHTGLLEKAEPFSWTAHDYPWVNHEVLSEVALGGSHLALGGAGVLLLKVLVGLVTFWIALRTATGGLSSGQRMVAFAFGALAVVEISYGFAARPQIFTALFLSIQLWLLHRIHQGQTRWAFALPLLFLLWINTHGGALAGVVLLWAATLSSTVQIPFSRAPKLRWIDETVPRTVVIALWLAAAGSTIALCFNPWGIDLIKWLIGSVLWLRPEIEEWNPTRLSWDHAVFFIVGGLTIVAFIFSRRKRALWEIAICGALLVLAVRSVRHTPLFSVAALALVPKHLADLLSRVAPSLSRILTLWRTRIVRQLCAVIMLAGIVALLTATVFLHKERFWTMEVPRRQYPVAAVDFMQQRQLHGNLLVFFDWGEMAIWELPACPPSVDGRLDTCYPRNVISAHWKFYNAEPFDESVLQVNKADLALLPVNLAGAFALGKRPGWQPVYYDDVAVVLARDHARFAGLNGLKLPSVGESSAAKGRAAFPPQASPSATPVVAIADK